MRDISDDKDFIIEMQNVSKLYGIRREEAFSMLRKGADKEEVHKKTGVVTALYDVNLKVPRGKIFVIIGLSGSGKSTIVRSFNRLNRPTRGKVLFDGVNIVDMSKKKMREFRREKIAMVFQSFGLMSHRNVLGNVAYGLEVKGIKKQEREAKALEAIELVGLEGLDESSIDSLSGGMRQRVGLARALATDPEVLLMDEPFSALDPLVRDDMQFELLSIQRKLEKTVIFITHDIDEAFKLGDTVAIVRDGRLVQVGTPEEMNANPADEYVERFIESADKAKVMTARNIMIKPKGMVRLKDSVDRALRTMRRHGLSSVFVVDSKLEVKGVISLTEALRAKRKGLKIADVFERDVNIVEPDILVKDLMPMAIDSAYPITIVDKKGRLKGIVTKASVLSCLMMHSNEEQEEDNTHI
ncbi:MAG: glycine betaine/L-proline ABC transporter ATP-binding protein [Clostridiales bacterium]|nr:glycine betaine/L-proline ABC transporter ATP-binding protein [Clostridiales bacterium]